MSKLLLSCLALPLAHSNSFKVHAVIYNFLTGGGGGWGVAGGWRGVLPIMDYTGSLRPKWVPFIRLPVNERVGSSLVEVYLKRVGNLSSRSLL